MKNKVASSLAWVLPLLLAFGGAAYADDLPNPDEVKIEEVIYAGSGCPPGSADVRLSPDGNGFRLIFGDEFTAKIGGGEPLSESRKNCQVLVRFHVPQGFTFAVGVIDFRGTARLASGTQGLFRSTHYFQGEAEDASTERLFTGPFRDRWRALDVIPIAELVWAPCGVSRALNINAQVRISPGGNPHARSTMTIDSERGRIEQLFQFSWKRCDE